MPHQVSQPSAALANSQCPPMLIRTCHSPSLQETRETCKYQRIQSLLNNEEETTCTIRANMCTAEKEQSSNVLVYVTQDDSGKAISCNAYNTMGPTATLHLLLLECTQRASNPPEFTQPGLRRPKGQPSQGKGSLAAFVRVWLVLPRCVGCV